MEWQPIETAPKDGTWILLAYREIGKPVCGSWHKPSGYDFHWCINEKWTPIIEPTHLGTLIAMPKEST